MEPLDKLDKDSILGECVFQELFEQEDEIKKARLMIALADRAEELGVKTKFNTILRAYKKVDQEMRKNTPSIVENWTNFTGPYDNMQCGLWIASDQGVYSQKEGGLEDVACYHPILPVERLKNLETGDEQLKLAYKRNHRWEEIIVPKDLVATASKITALSKRGIAVTSENAKLLVRFLSDVENLNDNEIQVQYSTSKLGWIKSGFIPYDTDIVFDGDSRFKQVFESIEERGNSEIWYDHVKELRKSGKLEIKFLLAAAFASVLIGPLGALPFIVDLWGETEGGKSVTLMLACSVWANPDESRYIGDFKTTDVALEARADLLNNLPMMLDDTSKTSSRIRDNFEGIVYDLCSGKGKSRSNKELGMNRENRWRCAILTNGERPLNSYVTQGGAINRILELECGERVYQDPQKTAELIKKNYGFAGRKFVDVLKNIGMEEVERIQQKIQREIYDDEKMQKQSISLSIVLAADRIATDYIFQDGQYIDIKAALQILVDRNDLSDNERCYQYILSEVDINRAKFDLSSQTSEKWGTIENGYAVIYNNIFDAICKKGGFSKKSFLSWADKNGLIQTQGGQLTKVKKTDGKTMRCVFLRLDNFDDEEGFQSIDDLQEELPFK
ncbi:DUF927 domain-containing protein [Faecalicatena acetigenes]|uniref:DUF927 domain-containing protein n=1 Tax=Faecalicatena acetigenes TaxID=2981790 RepID=A0ABT2TE53_9FIRM|nr:DUF927 domain-containing protein [Faecalicatena acetigenes]MCU6748565.1 DUF927 domain-containing protein [Faecalicatena acetigenes]SCI51340.1 Superfamily II helicase and inactivated derivatives [uncultured Clostridium sp.]